MEDLFTVNWNFILEYNQSYQIDHHSSNPIVAKMNMLANYPNQYFRYTSFSSISLSQISDYVRGVKKCEQFAPLQSRTNICFISSTITCIWNFDTLIFYYILALTIYIFKILIHSYHHGDSKTGFIRYNYGTLQKVIKIVTSM